MSGRVSQCVRFMEGKECRQRSAEENRLGRHMLAPRLPHPQWRVKAFIPAVNRCFDSSHSHTFR